MHVTFNFKDATPINLIGAPSGLFGLAREFSELYALSLNIADSKATYHVMNISKGNSLCMKDVDIMGCHETGYKVDRVCQSCHEILNLVDDRGVVPVSVDTLHTHINQIIPSLPVNTNYGSEVVSMVHESCQVVKPVTSYEFEYGGAIFKIMSMIEKVETHYLNSVLDCEIPRPIYFTALTESGPKFDPIDSQSRARVAHVCATLDSDYFKIKSQRLGLEKYAFARLFKRAEMGVLVLFAPRVILLPVINLSLKNGVNALYGCMPPSKPATDSQFGVTEVLNFVYEGFKGEAQAATVRDVISGYMSK